ncbi:MAG: pilus assembly protein [Alphaproteobacteria bacterium]|nr:pilus assembly protein [Alphaproteobacteria bacterium]
MRKQWWNNRAGAVMPLMAVSIIALVGMTGAAVDTGRAQLVQSKLSSALDAAGLAAGSNINTQDVQAEVQKYFDANFPDDYLGSEVTELVATVNDDNTVISLSAEAVVPVRIMQVMGFDTITVRATSEITRQTKGLEVVLVVDTTGSMCSPCTKIDALKDAAHDLIGILYGEEENPEDLYVGIVPFSQNVNVGNTRTAWRDATHWATLNWRGVTWAGCVEERFNNRDVTDDPPSVEAFRAFFWPDVNSGNYANDWLTNGGSLRSGIGYSKGPNKHCTLNPLVPMTTNRTTLDNAITNLTTNGNTHVNVGAIWGWRMLSPRWRGLWGGDMDANALPLDYDTPLMNKAVIIMTDGENVYGNTTRTSYGYITDNRLGTTSTSVAPDRLDDRLAQVCESMKAQGILVYTVAFDAPGANIETLLENCATNPDYFFNSPTAADLSAAFNAIGDSLSNLRVSR